MLSRRNFATMMIMISVILVLFLSSVVLKEYLNDYDVNHSAETEVIDRIRQDSDAEGTPDGTPENGSSERPIFYVGSEDNGYYQAMKEWAGYRKKSFRAFDTLYAASIDASGVESQQVYLLMDGELLEHETEDAVKRLTRYAEQGTVIIFYRLPSYQTIEKSRELQDLLGIQHLRAESVKLQEIRLFGGFLLGGETHYSFIKGEEKELVDMEREIPWYDISSRTKSYMVGFLSEEEKNSMSLENEDMPAIIWRTGTGNSFVFAVNGDYMKGENALGMLDAMIYESEEYALYSVVNAQNLSVAGFPDLTVENEKKMAEVYGMTTQQFCRDILWPSLVAGAQKGNWKITSFVSVKQKDQSKKEPNQDDLIDYLKYFNETSAEAGVSLGRIESDDLASSVKDESDTLKSWNMDYIFAAGFVRKENQDWLTELTDEDGKMKYFRDIRTVVGAYEEDGQILSWLTDQITLQNTTTDSYKHSHRDNLRLKSLETALGYSNIQVDMYRILWPESRKDEWQSVAEKMAANIDTYWKPYAKFDKTTISESDNRVRNFLNGSVESTRKGDQILIETRNFFGDAYLLLRTHGETPEKMTGGSWKQIEEGAYLLKITSENASVTLKSDIETYYK